MTMNTQRSRAHESRAAIQQLYISMRHLFIRGSYKPLGVSGEAMIEALKKLSPEIYGDINDPERVELNGLHYIFQRLPQGIEECRYIRLITREGFEHSEFQPIVPLKRRRNCYRIDQEQMFVEMTNGRGDIYDILTHLTFMYIESEKIRRNALDQKGRKKRDWLNLEKIIQLEQAGKEFDREVASTYLSTIIGRTFAETMEAVRRFEATPKVNSLFHIIYWMGRLAIEEALEKNDREISFSTALRERIGHHVYGERWANQIKSLMWRKKWFDRPLHIISSNPHSVMNSLFAVAALKEQTSGGSVEEMARMLSHEENAELRRQVEEFASQHGMEQLTDTSGTNLLVQLFDLAAIPPDVLPDEIHWDLDYIRHEKPILLVMDYAFGEQAFEVMDELLKPFLIDGKRIRMPVVSISIMGKAGILEGKKGDIMVPTAHVFEGTADNYPIDNDFTSEDFTGHGLDVFQGTMITVLGTSLQNKDILNYFLKSSWRAIGLEMEGAHYQKAIQAASRIRSSINPHVITRYAYYASDNPLVTGHTLASGSLGEEGVKPTYLITLKILNRIGQPHPFKKPMPELATHED
ncbi:MAG: hypothetical protein KatS3mg029_0392 [Saprospiraceae bacterium]|nr:MAG: hypothetical protein KatS3mg029_0392 [Saprospiraceae bacterium]